MLGPNHVGDCKDCGWFRAETTDPHRKGLGECHRHPPVMYIPTNIAMKLVWVWPDVKATDSCGDFEVIE